MNQSLLLCQGQGGQKLLYSRSSEGSGLCLHVFFCIGKKAIIITVPRPQQIELLNRKTLYYKQSLLTFSFYTLTALDFFLYKRITTW